MPIWQEAQAEIWTFAAKTRNRHTMEGTGIQRAPEKDSVSKVCISLELFGIKQPSFTQANIEERPTSHQRE